MSAVINDDKKKAKPIVTVTDVDKKQVIAKKRVSPKV